MITVHVNNVDPDTYCYDTGLTFGQSAAEKILDQINIDDSVFAQRNNYYTGTDYRDLTRKTGSADKTRELIKRQKQIVAGNPGLSPIQFKQYFLRGKLADSLLEETPEWLKINNQEPDCMLQKGQGGDFLPVHCGHHRKCSLFMLLEGGGQETSWYRPIENFDIIDPLRIPDLDKIEKVVSVVMQPRRWYLFNHSAWHSVHRYDKNGSPRINIGIDYRSIHAEELLKILKSHEQ